MRVPRGEELEAEAEGSRSRDRLSTGNSALLASTVVFTVSKSEALIDIRVNTLDASVLVVHVALKDNFLSASHTREDERFTIVISVSTHSEKNLPGVGALLESVIEAEDRVSRSCRQARPI